ncbi:unnamed protein product [Nesidiocoris tenuis]|uniref:Protein Wnt n=1 Tax=Nesidiocoris tenuis TaxID=355587 RepID=A0A6H5HSJ8_9HEMI|nr:unnamed protein product [Nesidiocoris tenuis]
MHLLVCLPVLFSHCSGLISALYGLKKDPCDKCDNINEGFPWFSWHSEPHSGSQTARSWKAARCCFLSWERVLLTAHAVIRNMQVRCKCHGVSGSCELKTCWRAAPDMRVIGHVLKERYREAVMVEETNVAGAQARNTFTEKKRRRRRKKKKKRKRKIKDMHQSLVFFEKSPSFCDKDTNMEMPGTTGRVCNRSSRGVDSCSSLCCGRGYNIIRRRRTDRCNCKFVWCCYVTCKNCTSDDWITVCK